MTLAFEDGNSKLVADHDAEKHVDAHLEAEVWFLSYFEARIARIARKLGF